MNSRERILRALDHKQPDRVPVFELYINESSIVKLAEVLRPETVEVKATKDRFGEERLEILDIYSFLIKELELDATCTNFSMGLERISENRGRDKYGTLYCLSEHGEPVPVEGAIGSASDIKGFDMVSKLEPDDFIRVQYVINKTGKDKAHFLTITDPFKISWRLRGGMQYLLMDYVLNPGLVHDSARMATDFNIAVIDMAIPMGIDALVMPGDLAGEETTLISPEHYREFIKPYHKEIVVYAHQKGLKIVKHSDGNLWPILDDFLEVGFDGIHPIQPQCMDIGEVKKYLAGRACILGNIDCRNLLPFGTKKEVEQTVKETIEKASRGGNYIVTSSNSIHPACKPENYIAMVKAVHKYGIYNR
ncbi:MAG: uroporphyrinogen decarboxylase family protein [Candidatus Hydrothermarchaeota archaeon]